MFYESDVKELVFCPESLVVFAKWWMSPFRHPNPTGYDQPVEAKSSSTATPSMTYVLGDRVLGQANTGGTLSWFVVDGHGSTRVLTDSSGVVAASYNYDAFGTIIGVTPSATTPIFVYAGDSVLDWVSGTYQHGDFTRGRQIGRDSFDERDIIRDRPGDLDNPDLYLYVAANPLNSYDPSGHLDLLGLTFAVANVAWDTANAAAMTVISSGVWAQATAIAGALTMMSWAMLSMEDALAMPQDPISQAVFDVSSVAFMGAQQVGGLNHDEEEVTVSRWGRPGLRSGDWVMNGPVNRANYFFSGKWQPGFTNAYAPFNSGEQYQVPWYMVNWPGGVFGPVKGMLGQRKYGS